MTFVAIAFSVTGDYPSKGDYINELLAVRADQQGHEVDRLHLHLGNGMAGSNLPTLAASFRALDEYIGADPMVIHDGYDWQRFLKQGTKGQPLERVKRVLALSVDVSDWSQRTYPRQRKDLVSLVKRLGLRQDGGLNGLERDVQLLVKVGPVVLRVPVIDTETRVIAPVRYESNSVTTVKPRLPFGKRWVLAWSVLLGDA